MCTHLCISMFMFCCLQRNSLFALSKSSLFICSFWVITTEKVKMGDGGNAFLKRHPLEIFPTEVWGIIFEKLKDPKDLASCSRASLTWNDILVEGKTTFLFPEVMSVIAAKKNISPFNFVANHPKCDIRNLRLVCLTWRAAIDNYVQCHPCHFQLEEPSPINDVNEDHHRFKVKSAVIFSTPESLDSFQRGLISYRGGNPFLSRHVILSDTNPDNIHNTNRMWAGFKNLLFLWGPQILYFEVIIHSEHYFFQIYQNIQESLCMMPNLRVLKLKPIEAMVRRELEVDWMRQLTETSPIPRLEHLEVFCARLIPTPMMNEALKNFPNIRCLLMEKEFGIRHEYYDYDAENLSLPKLRELVIPLVTANDLRTFERVTWPLETLKFVIYCKEAQTFPPNDVDEWLDITNILLCVSYTNPFGSTLKNLTLKLDGQNPWKAPMVRCSNVELNILHLQKLYIQMKSVQLENIEFVRNFNELKHLSIVMDSYQVGSCSTPESFFQSQREGEGNAELKFFSFMEHMNMYDSNVWELLPTLESLVFKLRPNVRLNTEFIKFRFKREEYNAKQSCSLFQK
ncbi:hypothetical protein Ocin01_13078 [Orchesella cincta]|uniref:F-box domain-containing protein n=1 Tax=Orchesella cincta TaxID=48709 RepID=A0A1D2MKN7_ORCCI|nr:hypothetical protein Ocin01_13078 [Orchesella cincta]